MKWSKIFTNHKYEKPSMLNRVSCGLSIIGIIIISSQIAYGQNKFPNTGNVGIGTTNPAVNKGIHIRGTTNPSDLGTPENVYGIYVETDGVLPNTYVFQAASNKGVFSITNSGKIGIGTTEPKQELHIMNYDSYNADLRLQKGNDYTDIWSGTDQFGIAGYGFRDFYLRTNGKLILYGEPSNGYVGINTHDPKAKFHVKSNHIQLVLENYDGGGKHWYIGSSDNSWSSGGGKLVFATSTNTLDSKFTIQNDGKIGIGTTNPSNTLDVNGGIDINDWIRHNGDKDTWIGFPYHNTIKLRTDGKDRIIVDEGGSVGIGTNFPGARLALHNPNTSVTAEFYAPERGVHKSYIHYGSLGDWYIRSANSSGEVIIQDKGGKVGIGTSNPKAERLHIKEGDSGYGPSVSSTLFVENYGDLNNYHVFQTATVGGGRSFSITNAGRVGIGVTSPSATLEVEGKPGAPVAKFTKNSLSEDKTALIDIKNGHGEIWRYGVSGDGNGIEIPKGSFYIESYGSPTMVISKDGKVGIGTTTPSNLLDVDGGIDINDYIRHNNDDNTSIGFPANDNIHLTTAGTERVAINSTGQVGIGTTTPSNLLDVDGGIDINDYIRHNNDDNTSIGFPANDNIRLTTAGTDQLAINSAGLVGIGTTTPSDKLHIKSGIENDALKVEVGDDTKLRVNKNGSVSVGTDSEGPADGLYVSNVMTVGTPQIPLGYKVAVAGKIIAEEVDVQLQQDWPDYVFAEDYKLKSLAEIKNFVEENQHLPDVPSADEVKENGIKLGEMNAILLQKIEELTLYMIELEKKNNDLEVRMQELELN